MAITLLAEAGLFVAAALLIGSMGEDMVASHQVALNVASLFFMIPLGLAMAITVRVGNAVGRGDSAGIRYAGFCGIGLTLVTQLISACLMLGFPYAIASLYTHDKTVIGLAAQLLLLAGLFQFSDGVQVASNGALRGLKDTRVPMAITLFAYWMVGMPGRLVAGLSCGARCAWHLDGADRRAEHGGVAAVRAFLAQLPPTPAWDVWPCRTCRRRCHDALMTGVA